MPIRPQHAPGPEPSYRVVSALPGDPRSLAEGVDWAEAGRIVTRLAAEGVPTGVLPDAAACPVHPAEIARGACARCGAPRCAQCAADAGDRLCLRCANRHRHARRRTRVRNGLALLGFAVFLYAVAQHLRAEAAALEPPVRVLIAQFVPHRLKANRRVLALNTPDGGAGRALADIGPFYTREHARLTGTAGAVLDLTLPPPTAAEIDPPPVPDRAASRWRDGLWAWSYARYFHALAARSGLGPDQYGARIYAVWTDAPGDVTADSRGSRQGRIAVVYLSTRDPNPGYAVIAVAHELAHVLGARDTYDERNSLARWPEGYAAPFAVPPWPQPFAELMAVDRPTGPHDEQEVSGLADVRVGAATAAGMGWIDRAVADRYYAGGVGPP